MSLLRSNIGCMCVVCGHDWGLKLLSRYQTYDNWHPHYQAKPGGALRFWNLFIHFWVDVDLDV